MNHDFKNMNKKTFQYDFLFYIPSKDLVKMFLIYLLQNIFNVKFIILIVGKMSFKPTVMKLYLGQWVHLNIKEVE